MRIFRLPFLFGALGLLGSCLPSLSSGGSGTCNTEGGVVNTYEIFARWKLVSGYATPRTKAELALDFDLLSIKKGTVACSDQVVNGGVAGRNFQANYSHDIAKKKITFHYSDGGEETASYSFAGSCDSTRMTLTYANGTETYEIYDTEVPDEACKVAE